MRRPLMYRRKRRNDGRLVVGGLLMVAGAFILIRLMPPWVLWSVVGIVFLGAGFLIMAS